jgi:hypothetical protein
VIHQVWSTNRVTLELHVPKSVHGGLLTGSYFADDVAWHPAGDAVAYIAEVCSKAWRSGHRGVCVSVEGVKLLVSHAGTCVEHRWSSVHVLSSLVVPTSSCLNYLL